MSDDSEWAGAATEVEERLGSAAAAATTGETAIAGGLWTSLSYGLPQIYILVLSVVAARFLGPTEMGKQSFISWASISVMTLLTIGIGITFQRYAAELRGRGQEARMMSLLHGVTLLSFALALAGGGSLVIYGFTRGELQSAWIFTSIACAAAIMHTIPSALLIGYQRFRDASLAGLVTGGFGVVATIVVLALGAGIPGIFAVEAVSSTAALIWLFVLRRDLISRMPPRQPLAELRRPIIRYTLYSSLLGLLVVIVERRSEFFALEAFSNPREIAFYSIAFAGVAALTRLVEGAVTPIVPTVATLFGAGDSERIVSGVSRALRLMLLVSLPGTAAALALGAPAIRLVYGGAYGGAEAPVLVLSSIFPLLVLLNLSGAALDGLGKVRMVLVGYAVAGAVDIGAALLLVPGLDAVGAALANVAAQATAAAILLTFLRRSIGGMQIRLGQLLPQLLTSVLAAAPAIAIGLLLRTDLVLFLVAPVFLASLGLAALVIRPLPRDDAEWMQAAMGHRLGGRVGVLCGRLAGAR